MAKPPATFAAARRTAGAEAAVALRALQGFAASSFAPAALAYAGEMYSPGRSAIADGLTTAGFMSAGVAGQLFAGVVERHLSCVPSARHLPGALMIATWTLTRRIHDAAR